MNATSQLINNVLTKEVKNRIASDITNGTGLPRECYTSEAWLELEKQRLFANTWMLAGFCHDIPNPGDAIPTDSLGIPLIILRNISGDIKVFHNVCRHRGATLIDKRCKGLKSITCPYHAWTYELDGQVKRRPFFYGANEHDFPAKPDAPGLVSVRHAVWNDLVFVNLSGQAVEFEQHFEPFSSRTSMYDFASLRHAKTLEFDVKGNWKLIHENFLDPYHVPVIHPRLQKFVPLRARSGTKRDGALFYGFTQFPTPEDGRGIGLPYYPGLNEYEKHTASYFHLFPTTCIQLWPDQLGVFELFPLSPSRTIERIHIFFVGEGATDPSYEARRQLVYDMWDELNKEDFTIVESMQYSRRSPGFDGGTLSARWDLPAHEFAKLVVESLTD